MLTPDLRELAGADTKVSEALQNVECTVDDSSALHVLWDEVIVARITNHDVARSASGVWKELEIVVSLTAKSAPLVVWREPARASSRSSR
jgi:hypothetical protein